jgi:hypothetical protein
MNSSFCLQQADLFADRILREVGSDPLAQIRHAWLIALQAEPSAAQIENASRFLKTQTATLQAATTIGAGTSTVTTAATQIAASSNAPSPSSSGTAPAKPAASPASASPPSVAAGRAALATLCQALLNSNAFLYVD